MVAFKPLIAHVPDGGLCLLLAGGLYPAGVVSTSGGGCAIIMQCGTFVLGGSTCHFLAVLLFLHRKGSRAVDYHRWNMLAGPTIARVTRGRRGLGVAFKMETATVANMKAKGTQREVVMKIRRPTEASDSPCPPPVAPEDHTLQPKTFRVHALSFRSHRGVRRPA